MQKYGFFFAGVRGVGLFSYCFNSLFLLVQVAVAELELSCRNGLSLRADRD